MNLGGRGCSEPRSHQYTPAWETERDSISKKKKEKKKEREEKRKRQITNTRNETGNKILDIKRIIKKWYAQLYTHDFHNLDEMGYTTTL